MNDSTSVLSDYYQALHDTAQDRKVVDFAVTYGNGNAFHADVGTSLPGYFRGLEVRVFFHSGNTGASSLAINKYPPAPLVKVGFEGIEELTPGDIVPNVPFDVTFNGEYWVMRPYRMLAHETVIRVAQADLNPLVAIHQPGYSDHYAIINGNLVTVRNLCIQVASDKSVKLQATDKLLALPKPLHGLGAYQHALDSEGTLFGVSIDSNGLVAVTGNLKNGLWLPLSIESYVAKYPLEYATIPA